MSEEETLFKVRLKSLLRENIVLLLILVVAAIVWSVVFSLGASSFLSNGEAPLRSSWNGAGNFDFFGITINYEFEGWADYDYYYLSWADQFLNGVTPYSENFDTYILNETEYDTPFFLPPLFLYLCSLGAVMGPLGPGFLISLLGFATAFPIFGIAKYLSENQRVGEIAAATYLLNPLILYHTAFQWLNPAPFVFFTVLSFYLLMKQKRVEGTLAMVTAIFFKQIAIFIALPLIAYLIRKPPSKDPYLGDESPQDESRDLHKDPVDLKGFAKLAIIVLVYAIALSFPYILNPGNYLYYMIQKPGSTLYNNVTTFPQGNHPITFTVLFILFQSPEWLAELINQGVYYSIFILPGVLGALGLCLFEEKDDQNLQGYWRRILFFTLILVFWVHIFSPRGIYKYYCVALMPFISILSSHRMMSDRPGKIKASLPMIIIPAIVSLVILIPNRNVYILLLILIMVAYILQKDFSVVYGLIRIRILRLKPGFEQ